MRVRPLLVSGLMAAGLLIGLLWSRIDPIPDPVLHMVQAPESGLDDWLANREAAFNDITPGAERHIQWASPDQRTPLAIVYLHGYSATRQEVSPLFEHVARDLGANLFLTRLQGHGRSDDAMAEATVQGWVDDAEEALAVGHRLGDRVILAGTSTGATLAVWCAAQGADIDGMVLISPNFAPRAAGAQLLLWPGRAWLARAIVGEYREWTPESEQQARYWTHRYPTSALFPMADLVAMTERADLHQVHTPSLVFISPDDQVVRSELVPERVAQFSPPGELVEITKSEDPSHHVLAGDILSPANTDPMARRIEAWITAL